MPYGTEPSTSKPKEGPKRLRFNPDDDLALLRQFVSENPLEDIEKWGNIQKNVAEITGKMFSIRTLKDHLHLLLDMWLQKDSDSQKKSGVEEIFSERDHLLQEVSDLCKNTEVIGNSKRKRPMNKEKQIVELGKKSRDQWALKFSGSENQENIEVVVVEEEAPTANCSNLDDVSNDKITSEVTPFLDTYSESLYSIHYLYYTSYSKDNEFLKTPKTSTSTISKKDAGKRQILGPVKRRSNMGSLLRKNALEYLQQKEDKDRQVRMKEMDLEERKLRLEERRMDLEEKRFELEAAERKEKLNIEKERMRLEMVEREKMSSTIASQQQFIQSLINKFGKY